MTDEHFQKFCSLPQEDGRWTTHKIFNQGRWRCASDRYIAIRVPTFEPDTVKEKNDKFPNMKLLFAPFNGADLNSKKYDPVLIEYNAEDKCGRCSGTGKAKVECGCLFSDFRQCHDCNDTGWKPGKEMSCRYCEGIGYEFNVGGIDGCSVAGLYIRLINTLSDVKIIVPNTKPSSPLSFTFAGGGQGMVMKKSPKG